MPVFIYLYLYFCIKFVTYLGIIRYIVCLKI